MPDAFDSGAIWTLAWKLAVCFLLGSIPFAKIVMLGTGVDITKFGSGNPGFNNVLRYSKWRAIPCLIGDAGKGLLAIWLFHEPGMGFAHAWMFGMAAILGHCYSPFLSFNGGKGVATAAGVMAYLFPLILAPCVAWYIALRKVGAAAQWRERGTIASLSAGVWFVALLAWREGFATAAHGLAMLAFVVWRHKSNFENMASKPAA